MVRSTDITNFTEHRQNLRQHFDRVKETGRPLYVTTNGETEAVVLSSKAFDDLAERAEMSEILAQIARSEADVKAGRVREAGEALRELAKKHGIKLK
jgi:prevent-host-death family protein